MPRGDSIVDLMGNAAICRDIVPPVTLKPARSSSRTTRAPMGPDAPADKPDSGVKVDGEGQHCVETCIGATSDCPHVAMLRRAVVMLRHMPTRTAGKSTPETNTVPDAFLTGGGAGVVSASCATADTRTAFDRRAAPRLCSWIRRPANCCGSCCLL